MSLLRRQTGLGRSAGIGYARKLSRPARERRTSRPLGCERVLLSVRVYVFCRFLRGPRRLGPQPETTSTRSTPITPIHLYYTAEWRQTQIYFGRGEITIRRCGSPRLSAASSAYSISSGGPNGILSGTRYASGCSPGRIEPLILRANSSTIRADSSSLSSNRLSVLSCSNRRAKKRHGYMIRQRGRCVVRRTLQKRQQDFEPCDIVVGM